MNEDNQTREHKTYHANGQLCTHEKLWREKLHGECKEWHNNERKEWFSNGQLHVHEFYQNGKLTGERKEWFSNGQLHAHAFYQNGNLKKERKLWHPNGQLWLESHHRNGELNGERKEWFSDGQRWLSEFYRNGNREGERKIWGANRLLVHQFYREGQVADINFTFKKKRTLLRMMKRLRFMVNMRKYSPYLNGKIIKELHSCFIGYM